MARECEDLIGRQAEVAALRGDDRTPALVVLRGAHGSGRTTVLELLNGELRRDGVTTLSAPRSAHHEWDRFGVGRLLAAVRDQFEEFAADAKLTAALQAAAHLCAEEHYRTSWSKFRMLNALAKLFTRLGTTGPVVLLVDDADQVPEPVPALIAVQRAGHRVVVSCTPGTPEGADRLCQLASHVEDLAELSDEDADALLRRVVNAPVDLRLGEAVRTGLGPLWGNPGAMLATAAELSRTDRLALVHGVACLRRPAEAVVLPTGHELFSHIEAEGSVARDLVVLSGGSTGFHVDEIPLLAKMHGIPATRCGQVADRLVHAGVLMSAGEGRLACRCPALGAALAEQVGPDAVRVLHRVLAQCLLDDGLSRPLSLVAGHVAAAGTALPARPELATLLRDDEIRLTPFDRERQVRQRHSAWWHCGVRAERGARQAELVLTLVRAADYRGMAEFVTEAVAVGIEPGARGGLAAAAVLAALHLGKPVPEPVAVALAGCAEAAEPLALAGRWFDGEEIRPEEIEAGFAVAWPGMGTLPADENACAELTAACLQRDLVPVLRQLLGANYELPGSGPLAAHHRVRSGYVNGSWSDALSAARDLELDPAADAWMTEHARLIAAEISGWRGDDHHARSWFEASAATDLIPALRAWVEIGLLRHVEGAVAAFAHGWRDLDRRAVGTGAARLQLRLVEFAAESGQPDAVLVALDERHQRLGRPCTSETVPFAQSLVAMDGAAVRTAEQALRARGHRFGLAITCLLVGMVEDDSERWFAEALEIALELEATRLTGVIKNAMEAKGLPMSSSRVQPEELSELEMQIIKLVRLGHTNRQIAQSVVMSEKTIEKHLTRLYLKTGCRNRYGLATSTFGDICEPVGA
ncbi:AAA family ATPase [Amycolatopsis sp. cg5]|uniref:AAA family ATPase n=1 Tax=Amycolatopsis sp. cg5 TaxID=3238802 RepID=UPI0035262FEA